MIATTEFRPMDPVFWERITSTRPYRAQLVPAEVYYRTKQRIGIKIVTAQGQVVKFVKASQLRRRVDA